VARVHDLLLEDLKVHLRAFFTVENRCHGIPVYSG
jgi:hypothetical protein